MKMLRNVKALSPVVASIILIAVTVAVSIAVAAWMGALSFDFTIESRKLYTVAIPQRFNATHAKCYAPHTLSGFVELPCNMTFKEHSDFKLEVFYFVKVGDGVFEEVGSALFSITGGSR